MPGSQIYPFVEENDFQNLPPPVSKQVDKSLGLFPLDSTFRQRMIKTVRSGSWFDSFILTMIVLNAVTMACVDYQHVDENYIPSSKTSSRNAILEMAELFFVCIFVMEFIMKVIANGFIKGDQAYLKDNWNKLDFIVVALSAMVLMPALPNLSILRSFRILKPLRSIGKLPGLKKIIGALVKSIDNLSNVMLLLTFLLFCFSVMGVQLWNGILHTRCRVTPFPVKISENCSHIGSQCWSEYVNNVTHHPNSYRCLPDANNDNSWTQSTSPWFLKGPQDCIWPIDINDERICSLYRTGKHHCSPIFNGSKIVLNRTCGSNFDLFGNSRFVDSNNPFGYPRMEDAVFIKPLNWGFTNYDSFLSAFVTSFQVITLEGWTSIMYQIIDSWSSAPTVLIFSVQIILCGYIVLNLVLAVITKSMDEMEVNEKGIKDGTTTVGCELFNGRHRDKKVLSWIESKYYLNFNMGCIIFNAIILSMDYYGISEIQSQILENLNFCFTIIFLIDVLVCNKAYGIQEYWSTPFTCFDGVISIISILELIIVYIQPAGKRPSSFSIFRSLRLFRIFKMAKKWKSLQILLKTMTDSVKEIGNFAFLLALFMFIYSLIGMQLLANRMHFNSTNGLAIGIDEKGYDDAIIPRSHFDNFFWSMVTVFQILSGENWNSVMYDGWKARGWVAVVYFISLVVVGTFIVMNLFLAILLKQFDQNEDLIDLKHEEKLESTEERFDLSSNCNTRKRPSTINIFSIVLDKNHPFRKFCYRVVESTKFDSLVTLLIIFSSICLALDNPLHDPNSLHIKIMQVLEVGFTIVFIIEMIIKICAHGFFFEKGAYLTHPWNILDFIIVLASILNLAKIGPGKVLTAFRALRVLKPLRMINRLPELRVVVDALILSFPSVLNVGVLCCLVFLMFSTFGITFLKGTFNHCHGETYKTLSFEKVNYLIHPYEWGNFTSKHGAWFDIDKKNLDCNSSSWLTRKIPTSKEVCNCLAPGEWVSVIPQNFNNVFAGMALLFEIATTEGWIDVMYASIDQRGIDSQPVRGSNPLWALFFIVFLIVGAFFILELFVAVTINNFNKIRDRKGSGLMTEAQKEWATTQAFICNIKPEKKIRRPKEPIRSWCYDLVMPSSNPKFQPTITAFILLNCICSSMVTFGDSEQKTRVLELFNLIFAGVFTLEVIFQIIALNKRYFDDWWNRFDFVVVCCSNIGILLSLFVANTDRYTSVIMLFRICRITRLIKTVKKLRTLFNTMVISIPSIVNIGSLLFLLFFIYSVAGMQLYSFIPENIDLTRHANFRSFGASMLLLLRFSTGENWNGYMRNLIQSRDNCDINPVYDANSPWCLTDQDLPNCSNINGCGARFSAYFYFYSFTLLVTFIIFNLFVGIVLEAFDKCEEGDILSPLDLDHFIMVWSEFDPDASWYIKVEEIENLLSNLKPPLGIGTNDRHEVDKIMKDQCILDLPVNSSGMTNIVNVATHLAKRIAIMKQGDDFHELSDDHPLQQRIIRTRTRHRKTLYDIHKMNKQKNKLRALGALVKTDMTCEFG